MPVARGDQHCKGLPPPPHPLPSSWLPSRARPRDLCVLCYIIKLSFAFKAPGPVIVQAILAKILGPCSFELQGQRGEIHFPCRVADSWLTAPSQAATRRGCSHAGPDLEAHSHPHGEADGALPPSTASRGGRVRVRLRSQLLDSRKGPPSWRARSCAFDGLARSSSPTYLMLTLGVLLHSAESGAPPMCNGENSGVDLTLCRQGEMSYEFPGRVVQSPETHVRCMASTALVSLLLFFFRGASVLHVGCWSGSTRSWESGNLASDPSSATGLWHGLGKVRASLRAVINSLLSTVVLSGPLSPG